MGAGVGLCDDSRTMSSISPPRKAFRVPQESYLGGVCSGLALHLGVSATWVRVFFLVTGFFGFGVVFYLGLWIALPMAPAPVESPGLEAASRQGRRPGRPTALRDAGPHIAFAVILLGVVGLVDGNGGPSLLWPALFAVGGIAVLWRQADQAQRERWLDTTTRLDVRRLVVGAGGWAAYARLAAGLGLLVTALLLFAVQTGQLQVAQDIVVAATLGVAGLAVILGPWLVRLVSDLGQEREARVRTQERADVAAHLHDSVLQTLALIQKNAADPGRVATLARAQERDLRSWMYGDTRADDVTVTGALQTAAAEVEDAHGVPVEVVVVGDPHGQVAVTEPVRAVLQAAREAMVNAASHSGAPVVDVYAEVVPAGERSGTLDVFVRDRGRGFDADAVPADRLGVRHSILDRVTRHGGRAEVRSRPGAGTEVRLHVGDLELVSRTDSQPGNQAASQHPTGGNRP